jgi:hypothetical protein
MEKDRKKKAWKEKCYQYDPRGKEGEDNAYFLFIFFNCKHK